MNYIEEKRKVREDENIGHGTVDRSLVPTTVS